MSKVTCAPDMATEPSRTMKDGALQTEQATSPRPSAMRTNPERVWRAWLCPLGSLMFLAPSFGFMLSVGVIQQYLSANQLSNYSSRDVGWIVGVYNFLALFLGIQAGPLADHYSIRLLAPLSWLLTVPMFIILGECTTYLHFMLCLGVLGGIGGAISSTVAISMVGKVFFEYRGLAMGIALSGCSLAAIIFPLMLRATLPAWGFAWSMRAVGFVVLAIMTLAVVFFWPCDKLVDGALLRNQSSNNDEVPVSEPTGSRPRVSKPSAVLNFSALRSPAFSLIAVSQFLVDFIVFGISGLLPTLVEKTGFGADTGYTLVAVLNGAAIVGRVMAGVLGDRLGHFNVMLIMMVFSSISIAVTIIPFGSRYIEALYAFSVVWGFGSGAFLPLFPVCMGRTCEAKDYGRFYGTMNFFNSFGLLITVPVGGQMLDSMGPTALSGFYLAVLALGGGSLWASRAVLLGKWIGLKEKI